MASHKLPYAFRVKGQGGGVCSLGFWGCSASSASLGEEIELAAPPAETPGSVPGVSYGGGGGGLRG